MISDVLFEALEQIRLYRIDAVTGRHYVGLDEVLDDLVEHMARVQVLLDQPPPPHTDDR